MILACTRKGRLVCHVNAREVFAGFCAVASVCYSVYSARNARRALDIVCVWAESAADVTGYYVMILRNLITGLGSMMII